MIDQNPNVATNIEGPADGESEGIDFDQVRDVFGFVLRAVRRRPKLAATTFVTVATLGLGIAATMPKLYRAQVKLLAQRTSAIRMLSSPNPGMDNVDNPTKNVAATILRRDNLVALVKEANLRERFDATRPPALRLKDQLMASVFGRPSERDMELSMVATLERQLDVATDDPTSTLVITVDWSNPKLCYDLVTLVQKNFLEARYDSDVAMITDSIGVLEEHAKNELRHVDEELEAYQKLVADKTAKPALAPAAVIRNEIAASPRPSLAPSPSERPDQELTKALEEKRERIRIFEEAHNRTLDALRQQLVQAQLTLTPMHPTVIALQQRVDALSEPSPDLAALKSEERALMGQIVAPRAMLAPSSLSARLTGAVDAGADPVFLPLSIPELDRDGHLQLAQSKLAMSIRAYEDALARIDAAHVELDITRMAYKHQYTVVTPAEVPSKPKKATSQIVGAGSVVGAALLALLLAAGSDLATGLILESWQVRRRLKLDVLGDLDEPS